MRRRPGTEAVPSAVEKPPEVSEPAVGGLAVSEVTAHPLDCLIALLFG